MELVEIIERQGNRLKKAKLSEAGVEGVYYTLTAAAEQWGYPDGLLIHGTVKAGLKDVFF